MESTGFPITYTTKTPAEEPHMPGGTISPSHPASPKFTTLCEALRGPHTTPAHPRGFWGPGVDCSGCGGSSPERAELVKNKDGVV